MVPHFTVMAVLRRIGTPYRPLLQCRSAQRACRYVITLTGDYSLGSWAYAIRWKNEALQKFRQFEAWVH
ncbi:hypothetical protein EN45_061930 [Penicillium chrysogenum]|uniref:Uncharacterized protein n=1 Tax=Penicillium chrysogenum TaxID=5076 RepID=A0A167SWX2_PENCH|nr:hypothetical protein EN45_061930 [Penicillium chrysogenum]